MLPEHWQVVPQFEQVETRPQQPPVGCAPGHAAVLPLKTVVVPALSSRWLEEEAFPEASVTEHYLSYAFVVEGEAVSRGAVLFCAPKHFAFRNPDLRVSAQDGEITVEASAFAKAVYVESDDPDLLLSDNFFDMDPGIRKLQVLRGSAEGLRVRSVYDI